jgi:GNAT superfamily N-acetyltransferase
MIIRPLGEADLSGILELNRHLNPDDQPLPDRATVEAVWAEIVASKATTCLGGFVANVLASTATVTIIPNLTRGCRPYALVENVVTHSAHRRNGYGRAVLSAALDLAWSKGCYKVLLLTGSDDENTLRFYERTGFNPGEKRAFVARPPV